MGKFDDRIPIDPGAKSKKKLRYESRKTVLKMDLDSRLN